MNDEFFKLQSVMEKPFGTFHGPAFSSAVNFLFDVYMKVWCAKMQAFYEAEKGGPQKPIIDNK